MDGGKGLKESVLSVGFHDVADGKFKWKKASIGEDPEQKRTTSKV